MNKKIHILFDFSQSSGGGKTFLGSLREFFKKLGIYSESPETADIVILNSHNNLDVALKLKKQYQGQKTFLHRIDGPMRVYNHAFDERDFKVKFLLDNISDGAIFQSQWSFDRHQELYGKVKVPFQIIHNAANDEIFRAGEKKRVGKIKVIGSSWSHQANKGGDFYQFLDQNLDFNKFDVRFVGKSSVPFKNIKALGILDQKSLAEELRQNDIYFFPSLYEACSNALLEGIASGLVPLVRKGSSNIEIVPDSRLHFANYEEALQKLNGLNLDIRYDIKDMKMQEIANEYLKFALSLKSSPSTRLIPLQILKLRTQEISCKIGKKINYGSLLLKK